MKLFELKQERQAALDRGEAILARVESQPGRTLTAEEQQLFDENMKDVAALNAKIEPIEARNTVRAPFGFGSEVTVTNNARSATTSFAATAGDNGKALAARQDFAAWVGNALHALGGVAPSMSATAPTGTISVGSGSNLDSISTTISTTILPYMASYFALDSFGKAGSTQISTDHTRPLFQPVLAAGAEGAVFAEGAAPSTSQPFGLSGFTFGGTKYSRLVLASYEALMNSELPLEVAILDELLSSVASTLTAATTTQMYAALTAASTLEVGTGGSNDIYSSLIDLRHAIPPRFDLPENKWMLSRATLATIRNKRASTSGVPMFDPESNQVLGSDYVINDNFDTVCGAGFVVFGSWANGAFLRRTPVLTRVLQELYAQNGSVGFRTTQWADSHFMAELAGSAQPPSAQPLYYTSLASES